MNDKKIVTQLKAGGKDREAAFQTMIRRFSRFIPKVARATGITTDQAKDTFTDALLALNDQVISGKFQERSKLSSYFYQIFYNKSVDFSRKSTTKLIEFVDSLPDTADAQIQLIRKITADDDMKHLVNHLEQLGEPCRKILLDWGYWGYKISEIAERMESTPDQIKRKKYRCLQQLRNRLKL